MTTYKLTKPHFLRSGKAGELGTETWVPAGEEIDWDAPPTLGMEGIDDEGRAKCKERDEKRRISTEQSVQQGRLSRVMAENIGPKTEPLPEEDDEPHRTRRPKGR